MDFKLAQRPWYIRYRTHITAIGALCCIIIYTIITALSMHRKKIDSEHLKIAEVKETSFLEFVEAEGIVHPIMTIQLNAKESGFIERIVREEGAMVCEGDTILILNNPELLRTIDEEREEWEKNKRNLHEQGIQMEQKSIDLRLQALELKYQIDALERKLRQNREEFSMGIKSRAELDIIEAEHKHLHNKHILIMQSLKHDSAATQLRREMIMAGRKAAEQKLLAVQKRTKGLIVCATHDGQLGNLNLTIGQQIASGTKVGEIKIMNRYKMRINLGEYYVERIYAGQPATITYKEDTFKLRISRVVPEVKNRQFEADLLFNDALPDNIRLGKSYRVKVELARPEKTTVIPRGDFYKKSNGEWIFKVDEGTNIARKTEIKIGRQNPQQFEILEGVKAGDRIVVGGYDRIGDAEEIKIN